jgi:hypothetical protein
MIGMNFDVKSNNVYVATNSIKPVNIREVDDFEFYMDMPEGINDYFNDPIKNMFFKTFDEAKRWAESYVGFTMPMGELIASAEG